MKKIRILSLMIVAILVCAMLAGCESALSSIMGELDRFQEQQGQESHENQASQEKVETDQVVDGGVINDGEGGQYNVIVNGDGTITNQFGSGDGGKYNVIVNDDGTIMYQFGSGDGMITNQFGSGEGGMQAIGGFGNLIDGSVLDGIFGNGTDVNISVSD